MTAQRKEILLYKGQRQGMAAEPLNDYLATRPDIELGTFSTACWRGHYGTWEIIEDHLYLVELKALLKSGEKVGVEYFFQGKTEVLADWFTGEIRVPLGNLLQYVHQGYTSMHEKDMYLTFEQGVLKSTREEDNAHRTPEYTPRYLQEIVTLDWTPAPETFSSFTREDDLQGLAALAKEGEELMKRYNVNLDDFPNRF